MKKKIITAAMLSLALLQSAGSAYADGDDDYIQKQNLGGAGDGPVARIALSRQYDEYSKTVSPPIGGVAVKLNGQLKFIGNWDERDEYYVKKGSYHGDAFVTAVIDWAPVIKKNLDFWCDVEPVDKVKNQFWFKCEYFKTRKRDHGDWDRDWDKDLRDKPVLFSTGQCYIDITLGLSDLFKPKDRNAACNFLYKAPIHKDRDGHEEEYDFLTFEEALPLISTQFVDEAQEAKQMELMAPVSFPIMFSKSSLT